MKKSLSTRLMYSFMTIIIIIVVGITAGISYLIADYFFEIKEQELAEKGHEMADNIRYFIGRDEGDTVYRYIVAVDRLVGARIWLFDDKYELLAASQIDEPVDTAAKKPAPSQGFGDFDAEIRGKTKELNQEIKKATFPTG